MAVRDRCTVCSIIHAVVYFIYIANTFFRTFLEKRDYWASERNTPLQPRFHLYNVKDGIFPDYAL